MMKFRFAIAAMVCLCQGAALAKNPPAPSAPEPVSTQAPSDKTYMATPDGKGDPGATTCRPPQKLPNSRLLGPEVCKTNAMWARYAKDGMDVAADGIHDVPAEKFRSLNPRACHPVTMGGGGTGLAFSTNFSQICD